MTHSQSTKKKWKIQGIEVTKYFYLALIFLAVTAIIGVTAPYTHMFYDKTSPEIIELDSSYDNGLIDKEHYTTQRKILKDKHKFLGFTNVRRFLFAIGLPIALFVSSIFFLLSTFIKNAVINRAFRYVSIPFVITGVYFITWTLWDPQDFPESVYYTTITVLSFIITAILYYLFKLVSKDLNKLHIIKQHIKPLKRNVEFVKDLADIMPETNETISYKALTSTTSDDLQESIEKIEETLND